ncbi:MAG: HNH endonuclease [Lachnospiraceae bacterium]|nr:HNH endonuclease [Lachnospiraceae bacterium]
MAKDFTGNFYQSAAWKNCRAAYIKSVGGLCERCYANGIIRHGDTVHHKIHLTPENINDPAVTLNFENLCLVCRDCHAYYHKTNQQRYRVDQDGHIVGYD